MVPRGRKPAVWCAALILFISSVAAAQKPSKDQQAAAFYKDGYARANNGDYAGAVAAFKRAMALKPSVATTCNIGLVYVEWRRLPQAEQFLAKCIANPPKARAASLRSELDAVRKKLRQGSFAPVELKATPADATVRVSGFPPDESIRPPATVWLPHGSHELTFSKPGYIAVTRKLTIVGSSKQRVEVGLKTMRKPVAKPDKPLVPITKPTRVVRGGAEPVSPNQAAKPRSRLPLISTITGAALLLAGGGFHLLTWSARKDVESVPGVPQGQVNVAYNDALDVFVNRRLVTIGLYTAGGIALAAGLYLYSRGGKTKERSVAVTPYVSPAGGGLALTWTR